MKHFLLLFLLFLSCLQLGLAAQVGNFEVKVDSTGGFQLYLSNKLWFNSADAWFHANDQWYTTADKTLTLTGTSNSTGRLDWGPMNIYTYTWKTSDGKLQFTTYTVVFTEVPAVIFGQQWDDGGNSTSTGSTDDIISRWPSFKAEDLGLTRGYASWGGGQIGSTPVGVFGSSLKEIYKSMEGGLPIVIFDSDMENTVVISPQNSFMSAHHEVWKPNGSTVPVLATGILGSVETVPKGFSLETLVVAGQNLTGTMDEWGRLLRMRYKKDEMYRRNDYSIKYLGYYTDNGACYHYYTGNYDNYEEIMLDIKKEADQKNIPYRYLQLDSWWYFKGDHDGVKNWTAMPSVFPNGIEYVSQKTGWPIVAHNRFFSSDTDYAKQNGGKFNFIVDTGQIALPNDPTFWQYLLSTARDQWNLWTYEQDWLLTESGKLKELQMDIDLGQTWLGQMGEAAKEEGLTIQYCMAWPRHVLQAVMIPVVTQTRASGDYHPGGSQWKIGDSSILLHSLGIAPFKDNFHSTSSQTGCKTTATEPSPALQAHISVLSTGPVAPGDAVGFSNKDIIMTTCMSDGLLLKPSRPAMSLDSTFVQRAFGKGGPDGYLTATYTEVSGYTWYYVLGAELKSDYQMSLSELPPSRRGVKPKTSFPESVAVQHAYDLKKTVSSNFVKILDASTKLMISSCGVTDFQYWYIAPVLPGSGGALLGELDKVVPISEQRVLTVILFGGTYVVKLRGAPGEVVSMTTFDTRDSKTTTIDCTMDSTGAGSLGFSDVKNLSC